MKSFSERTLPDLIGSTGLFTDGDWIESKDQDPNGDVRLIQLADIGDGEFLDKSARFLTSDKATELKCTFLEPGDILLARMPDPLGRACIFPGNPRPCVVAVDICIIRLARGNIDKNWLVRQINSPEFRFKISRFATGTTRKRISRSNLAKIRFSVPPLEEQRRIAAILDTADTLRTKRRQAIAKLDTLLQSTFLTMFGDPVTNPMGWEVRPLGEVATIDAPMVDPTLDQYKTLPHIGADKIEKHTGKLLDANTAEEDGQTSGKFLFDERYVLYSKIRPYLQKVALPDFVGLCSADVYPIKPGDNRLLRELLYFILLSDSFTTFTDQHSGRANIPKINRPQLLSFECYLPPENLQLQFLRYFREVTNLGQKHRTFLEESETMFDSLQQRAFRGDL